MITNTTNLGTDGLNSVESIVKELVSLRTSPRLEKESMPRARDLLRLLKRRGYSAKKIEDMTQRKWKQSAIKYHTEGVPASDSSEPRESLGAIADMAAEGINLEDVREATAIKRNLEAHGLSIANVASVMEQISHFGISLNVFISTIADGKRHGIPISELGDVHTYKKMLEEVGINDAKKLGRLYDLICKQGARSFDSTIGFIQKFDRAELMQSEIDRLVASKKEIEESISSMQVEMSALKEKKKTIQSWVNFFSILVKRGFTEVLAKLAESSKKYGVGLAPLLDAINRYGSVAALNQEIEKTRATAQMEQARLDRLKAENLHLENVITMSHKLLQLNYRIPAIEQITRTAEKYGPAIQVLQALDQFEGLAAIQVAAVKARDYDRIKQERDNEAASNRQLQMRMADYLKIKRSRDELLTKLDNVNGNSIRMLEDLLIQLEVPKDQRIFDQAVADSGLPELVEKAVEKSVAERLNLSRNNALLARFTDEVKKQVGECLIQWPENEFGARTPEKVQKLEQLQVENPLIVLKGVWPVKCPRCQNPHSLSLATVYDIKELLIKHNIPVPSGFLSALQAGSQHHFAYAELRGIVRVFIRRSMRER